MGSNETISGEEILHQLIPLKVVLEFATIHIMRSNGTIKYNMIPNQLDMIVERV